MKRVLCLAISLLCLSVVLTIPAYADGDGNPYAVTGGNIYFDPAAGAVIGCDESVTEAVIPSEIDGAAVTVIEALAFSYCRNLTAVTIPETVTSIGYLSFFGCAALKSVEIPESITQIGYEAFSGCSSLTSIALSSRMSYIATRTFQDCSSLAAVTIPASIKLIEPYAFAGSGLKEVTYTGTEEQWHYITGLAGGKSEKNQELFDAKWICTAEATSTEVTDAQLDVSSNIPKLVIQISLPIPETAVYGVVYDKTGQMVAVSLITVSWSGEYTLQFKNLTAFPEGGTIKVLLCGGPAGQPLNEAFLVK